MSTPYTHGPGVATFPDTGIRDQLAVLSDPKSTVDLGVVATRPVGMPDRGRAPTRAGRGDESRVDAFSGRALEHRLWLDGIRTSIHTGIATELGILPMAWHVIQLGFFAVVPEDLLGSMPSDFHHEAIACLRRLTLVTRAEDIVKAWRGTPP
jgi:hypothetical protein